MAFRSDIRIRFGDEDHAGIVYYPRFFDYFHRAFEDFFEEAGGCSYKYVLDEDRCGWPSVHAEATFLTPLRFGDVLILTLTTERIGTSSATFAYHGRRSRPRSQSIDDVVRGRVTVVCVQMGTLQPRPIPDRYRRLFEAHRMPTEAR